MSASGWKVALRVSLVSWWTQSLNCGLWTPWCPNDTVPSQFGYPFQTARTKGNSSRRCIIIDPEGHPREDGDEDRGHVRLQNEVSDVPLQPKAQWEPRVGTCRNRQRLLPRMHGRHACALTSVGQWRAFEKPVNWGVVPSHTICFRLPAGVGGRAGWGTSSSLFIR